MSFAVVVHGVIAITSHVRLRSPAGGTRVPQKDDSSGTDAATERGNMPIIDSTESEAAADRLLDYWTGKIRSMGAEGIAGVRKVSTNRLRDEWDIELEVYVAEDSAAFKDFMKRFK